MSVYTIFIKKKKMLTFLDCDKKLNKGTGGLDFFFVKCVISHVSNVETLLLEPNIIQNVSL